MGWLGRAESRYWWKCRLLFGLRVGDINSKFKLFRRHVFDRMVLQSDGEFVHAEILAKANFLGSLMDEIVLGDRPDPPASPDVGEEMWTVFHDPQFRSRSRPRAWPPERPSNRRRLREPVPPAA